MNKCINNICLQLKGTNEKKVYVFDAEHERKRKEQLRKLFDRTQKQIEEEQMLQNEMKKIEARKKERERKTQDLQKLISQADQQGESSQNTSVNKKTDKKLNKKKIQNQTRTSKVDSVVSVGLLLNFDFLNSKYVNSLSLYCRRLKQLELNLLICEEVVCLCVRKR